MDLESNRGTRYDDEAVYPDGTGMLQVYKLFSSQAMILGYISRIQLIIHTMRPQQIL